MSINLIKQIQKAIKPLVALFLRFGVGYKVFDEIVKEAFPALPNMSLGEAIVQDYTATKFSLRAHPLSLLRDILTPSYQSIDN